MQKADVAAYLAAVAPRAALETCRASLFQFVRFFWEDMQTGTELRAGWYLRAICDHLEAVERRQIRRLIINAPPRSLKSTVASQFFPAWCWLRNPATRFLTATYDQKLALRDSWASRLLMQGRKYQTMMRASLDSWRFEGDQNEKSFYANSLGGFRTATQVGGGTGRGAGIIIVDDPLSIDESRSDVSTEAANQWLFSTCWTRQDDPETSAFVIIQHRLRPDDPSGEALRRKLGFVHVNLPLEFDPAERKPETPIGWNDPRTEHGESLHRRRWTPEVIAELKESLQDDFQALCNQRPSKGGGSPIKLEWIRRWGTANPIAPGAEVVQSWDTSFKGLDPTAPIRQQPKRSRTAGLTWGMAKARAFLLDYRCERMDFEQQRAAILAMHEAWKDTRRTYIEDEANGPALINSLSLDIKGIIGVLPKKSKYLRLVAVAHFFRAGNVFLPPDDYAPWVPGYVHRLTNFPTVEFDDEVDATSQILSEEWLPKELEEGDPVAMTRALAGGLK